MNKKINLVFGCDNNYVKLLVPCIVSILYNKNPDTEISIFILESGISEYNKEQIKKLENFNNITNCKIEFIDINNACPEIKNYSITHLYYSTSILYRLFIPIIFKHLDRVLYLDADLIVRVDLLDLYNQDFENNYCALYTYSPLTCTTTFHEDKTKSNSFYKINSGVILFNIPKIIADKKDKELIEINKRYPKGPPLFTDQDMIADVCLPYIKNIGKSYNYYVESFEFFKSQNDIDKKNSLRGLEECKILHFFTETKPIHLKNLYKILILPYKEFYKYYQMSYLKKHPLKLKWVFAIASLKRFRRNVSRVIKRR